MTGWRDGLGPWKPVRRGRPALRPRRRRRRLRGVRVADRASRRCRRRSVPHARCVVLIEACEESGSYDLPAYIEHLAPRIGDPEPRRLPRLGLRQLRPAVEHDLAARPRRRHLTVEVLQRRRALRRRERHRALELPHPAPAARSRLEDETPARSCSTELHVDIPAERGAQAKRVAEVARPRASSTSSPSPTGVKPIDRRPGRAGAQPHLAAGALDHRRRGLPADRATRATCCGRAPRLKLSLARAADR